MGDMGNRTEVCLGQKEIAGDGVIRLARLDE